MNPDEQDRNQASDAVVGGPPAAGVRKAGGGIPRFDEIVQPHPVVAFLFRRRTLIVLIGVLAIVPWSSPRAEMLYPGLALVILAELWRIWAAGTIHKTEELTTGGPYAWVRHPLYIGSFLHCVGYCLMSGHWLSFAILMPLFVALYGSAVSTEEAMLHKLFGDRWEAYAARTPRFIPGLRRPVAGDGRFSWAQVALNKEWRNVAWVVGLSALYVWKLLAAG